MSTKDQAFRAPKGTNDLIPPDSWGWQEVTRLAFDTFAAAGYAPIETPIFEHTEVFERGVGETSEVVGKQMYTFEDRGGRSLTLRPELTAPVVRAVLEHGLHRGPLPIKLCYVGPMFRQERPQKGRYRQFSQVGVEAIGSDDPKVDAEVIEIGVRFLKLAGTQPTLLLNSIGHLDRSCRLGFMDTLVAFLREREGELAEEDRDRVNTNPLRTFDSKEPDTIAVMKDAPLIIDHLCDPCRKHFETVQDLLKHIGVEFELEPRLVRGLDYYTRTAFEFVASGLGSQNAVGGGGRYDGLAESLGGDPLPGIGFALGLDRILLARPGPTTVPSPIQVYVVAIGEEAGREALRIATELRATGIAADLDLAGRAMKGQMKDASRSGARWAVIIGEEELVSGRPTLKDLESGEQTQVSFDEIEDRVRS
ncbi:MAG: histidyl-tRNA synthetase [Actinomycetota bacterium]|nr:histidyl-tRNA synthetase [Actinomycetota bacterium]